MGRIYADVVLIDTWWNVNVGRIAEFYGADGVLIDTWWNVNECKDTIFRR